ncbi:MAG TPA: hypothetical protein VMC03_03745 [Streptosporangiaceae bacterium]|nr:hypothetical protein [Streptosporangiaceae bacterium]
MRSAPSTPPTTCTSPPDGRDRSRSARAAGPSDPTTTSPGVSGGSGLEVST